MRATMTLPGETEAGSAGMQPCRGITWWAHRDDVGRGGSPFAPFPKTHRIGRPLCLENPRPEGAEYLLAESAPAPFHAEPGQLRMPLATSFSPLWSATVPVLLSGSSDGAPPFHRGAVQLSPPGSPMTIKLEPPPKT